MRGVEVVLAPLPVPCTPGLKRHLVLELQHRREKTNSTQGCRNTAQTSRDGLSKGKAPLELKLARVITEHQL